MRAILIKDGKGPIENLYLGEAPEPVLKHGQVMVKIKAFGLNRMDILQRNGNYAVPAGASDILGVEFSGTVSSLGEGTTKFKVGDEVFGIAGGGAYAEYIVVSETHLLPKPSHLSWVEAASIPEAFLTAYQAVVVYGEMKEGESVLVHAAASGVGIAAIQMARVKGAKTVIATASTRDKLDWLVSIPNGATHGVNYKTQNFAEEVKKITDNNGCDVVVDFVGQSHWNMNIESMARDGRMTMLALLSGSKVSEFNLGALLFKRLRIQGSTLRSRTTQYQADLINKFTGDLLGMITGKDGQGPIKTYIHKVYSWKDIQDAHRDMEGNQTIGKLIVVVD
ncbi:hypothetical protein BDP27DRAFT_1478656 [Rhodocollybia butyracea]|uniref:Enoyl reductase (ER) domain-containing protein n=1 Tax=Rhodocollybia butyracea TaxID=206335 RepID=A0A9P5PJN2_9AGAR|nr:hypothetical protein BDP27DRAFT_1478656 [Rhodocollybia butyracea]